MYKVINMILNTTHPNREHKQLLKDVVGRSFTLLESLKMKGVGSKRMIVGEVSSNMKSYINKVSDINYANIELRKNGILIFINKGLQNFTWAIPYFRLVLYKTNGASIHADGKFIHFKNNKTFKENKSFFRKMLDEKIKYDEQYSFQNI